MTKKWYSFPRTTELSSVAWRDLETRIQYWDKSQTETGHTLELCPDFQRGHVWTHQQKVAYVEFKLSGGFGSDVLIWNHPQWNRSWKANMVLVDGLQRLSAVREFISGQFTVFDGVGWGDIPAQERPSTAQFYFTVASVQSRKELLEWYLKLNSGGTPHSQADLDKVKALLETA